MITYSFLAFLALAITVAFVDWRRGWILAIVAGVLQDPVRKVTPGTPVILTLSIVPIYLAILFGASGVMRWSHLDVRQKYPRLYRLAVVLAFFLILAALNGLMNFGIENWRVPALGLFVYTIPIPALLIGYAYLRNEEDLIRFFKFYTVLTSIALIGVPLEYLRVDSPLLGTVGLGQDLIRHLPGIQIRILSGFYRSPDIMAWHAAMLTVVSLVMMIRRGFPRGWLWLIACSWGFLNTLLSGRRKMIYMLAVFVVIFLFRYVRRMSIMQTVSIGLIGVAMWVVVDRLATTSQETSVYALGAATSRIEVLQRLEGGALSSIQQSGIMGVGLGYATQGAHHLAGRTARLGWQEGGAAKLIAELGLPGFLFAIYFLFAVFWTMFRLSSQRDAQHDVYLIRVALFGILAANVASFAVSAQAYSDAVLTLMNAFFIGAMLATPRVTSQRVVLARPRQESQLSPIAAT